MGITRQCGACGEMIPTPQYMEVQLRVLKTHLGENQDDLNQVYDSYCDTCVQNGAAIKDLLASLEADNDKPAS